MYKKSVKLICMRIQPYISDRGDLIGSGGEGGGGPIDIRSPYIKKQPLMTYLGLWNCI